MTTQNPYYYLGANPTVDLAIINPFNQILLIKRSENTNACPGQLALPGGFIDSTAKKTELWASGDTEEPQHAAIRELAEETNLTLPNDVTLNVIGIFEGNQRDPRDNSISWSKSHAFMYQISKEVFEAQKDKIKGMDDAVDASWYNLKDVANLNLAFDHNIIVNQMLEKFMPEILNSNKLKL